jgi:hypothetical protein
VKRKACVERALLPAAFDFDLGGFRPEPRNLLFAGVDRSYLRGVIPNRAVLQAE